MPPGAKNRPDGPGHDGMPGNQRGAAYDHLQEINPAVKIILSSRSSLANERASADLGKGDLRVLSKSPSRFGSSHKKFEKCWTIDLLCRLPPPLIFSPALLNDFMRTLIGSVTGQSSCLAGILSEPSSLFFAGVRLLSGAHFLHRDRGLPTSPGKVLLLLLMLTL